MWESGKQHHSKFLFLKRSAISLKADQNTWLYVRIDLHTLLKIQARVSFVCPMKSFDTTNARFSSFGKLDNHRFAICLYVCVILHALCRTILIGWRKCQYVQTCVDMSSELYSCTSERSLGLVLMIMVVLLLKWTRIDTVG